MCGTRFEVNKTEKERLMTNNTEDTYATMKELGVEDLIRTIHAGHKAGDELAAGALKLKADSAEVVDKSLAFLKSQDRFNKRFLTIMSNVLFFYGRSCPRFVEVCEFFLGQKNFEIVCQGLFALCFYQDKTYLPMIESLRSRFANPKQIEVIDRAVKALHTGDPRVYSPWYRDSMNKWNLSPSVSSPAD